MQPQQADPLLPLPWMCEFCNRDANGWPIGPRRYYPRHLACCPFCKQGKRPYWTASFRYCSACGVGYSRGDETSGTACLRCQEYNPKGAITDSSLRYNTTVVNLETLQSSPPPNTPVIDRLDHLLQQGQTALAGNGMLSVLTRPGQAVNPDADVLALAGKMRGYVAAFSNIPPELVYELPHQEHFLDNSERWQWTRDTYIQLIIYALLFQPTAELRCPPHSHLSEYYWLAAREQQTRIGQAKNLYEPRRRQLEAEASAKVRREALDRERQASTTRLVPSAPPAPTVDAAELADLIRAMQAGGMSADDIAKNVAALVTGQKRNSGG